MRRSPRPALGIGLHRDSAFRDEVPPFGFTRQAVAEAQETRSARSASCRVQAR